MKDKSSRIMLLAVVALLLVTSQCQVRAIKINQRQSMLAQSFDRSELEGQERFLGTMLWDIVDLFTFGVFEKKPSNATKDRKNNRTNQTNCSNQTNQTVQQQNAQPTIIQVNVPQQSANGFSQPIIIPSAPAQSAPPPAEKSNEPTESAIQLKIDQEAKAVTSLTNQPPTTSLSVTTGPGAIITYLSLKAEQHQSQLDKDYVQSVFEGNSIAQNMGGEEQQMVTKGNAILAYEEIFKMWTAELDLQQEKTLKDTYFENAWLRNRVQVGSQATYMIPLTKGYEFLMDLMINNGNNPNSIVQINSFGQVQREPSNQMRVAQGLGLGNQYLQKFSQSPYLQGLTQSSTQLVGLEDTNMSTDNLTQTGADNGIGSQAKDLYGGIKSFNNQLIKIQAFQQEQNRQETLAKI